MAMGRLRWTVAAIFGLVGVFSGVALGVPGGAHLREAGKALVGEAEQFWLGVFLVLSFALGLFRTTRWGAVALLTQC